MNINLDSAKDTLCKNILIYGHCKFENKGCAFGHSTSKSQKSTTTALERTSPVSSPMSVNTSLNGKADTKKRFNFNTPSFQPSPGAAASAASVGSLTGKFSGLSPKLDKIPTFVPSGESNEGLRASSVTPIGAASRKFNTSASVFTPSTFEASSPSVNITPNPYANPPSSAGNQSISSMGSNDMYYQHTSTNYPLNYHLYAPAPPPRLMIPLPSHQTNSQEMFIPNDLRETLQRRNETTLQTLGGLSNLPDNVGAYHSLMPVDMETKSSVFGVNSAVYKVFSNVDGLAYALRKFDHSDTIQIDNKGPFKTVERWKRLQNSNIVGLHDCFTTIAFGGNRSQLCVVYDYYPNANTLSEQHINRKLGSKLEPINEDILWCYIIQITNALMDIHKSRLAARSALNLSKILVVGKNRIKLSSCGIDDIFNHESDDTTTVQDLQKQDLERFGKVVLSLALLMLPGSPSSRGTQDQINSLKGVVGDEMIDLLVKLNIGFMDVNLDKFNQFYLSKRSIKMINDLQKSQDYIESQLTNEVENARLFRLISKINFIVDSPHLLWKENEKVNLIKLFNDYIFHQHDESNRPIIDLSRVLIKLNKLDCGIEERFMLVSRDEKLSILVSYKELRDIIDSCFRELAK
ncbi:hypothetical protein CANTEDRAFT_114886 [Yamadazyma tenuis ATCC 10573]|uniref:PAN2-PAN3 deadenylation complex subunit PAN3 n=2 Tax=Candida tenuis (strain ATCC 10573 / BCRC 21748 / CBS 615 / JCM 9827 / NBRC 10315 / NRRL Y-1498 / VKM Y-70) TaxID=590646 RepID=G3BAC4_CANTC|nr:uncharacterized protein CANTEDRAFT_114886 [Yamadazyma tenuis ATCC 10573]EGV61407.1 hypothetical protein CANTEDRAFT_114886 [Yamadazyma tenuis ATCC 10573]